MNRAQLEQWVINIHREARAVDPTFTDELTRELTGGHDDFCPQPYPAHVLHNMGAALLLIARLQ